MRLLLISGSLRANSTNTALLRTVQATAPGGLEPRLYSGLSGLPHFNPDDDHEPLPPEVMALRASIAWADALLFSTPEYAGALPGAFKNLLDWTVGGGEMNGRAAGWVNVAGPAAPNGGEDAHASLRRVLGYTGSVIVEAACIRTPLLRQQIGPDGLIGDLALRERLVEVLKLLMARHSQEKA
ncbi:NADPH-dependent FMN reductase [Deinococcus sp.]|uniref:NADPH-dependent FMN reductase n=1 Tax=Deinococcus sp. TaxID=47478 RepID=UPI003C7E1E6B